MKRAPTSYRQKYAAFAAYFLALDIAWCRFQQDFRECDDCWRPVVACRCNYGEG